MCGGFPDVQYFGGLLGVIEMITEHTIDAFMVNNEGDNVCGDLKFNFGGNACKEDELSLELFVESSLLPKRVELSVNLEDLEKVIETIKAQMAWNNQ